MPDRAPSDRQQAYRSGRRGEGLAALFLRLKGYRILERNWRSPVGEVDLIARRRGTLVFAEVKTRPDRNQGREAVQSRQKERITRAAEAFLSRHPDCANMQVRFDLIAVAGLRWPDHIQAAWGYD